MDIQRLPCDKLEVELHCKLRGIIFCPSAAQLASVNVGYTSASPPPPQKGVSHKAEKFLKIKL